MLLVQGDVFLHSVDTIPESATLLKPNPTGHVLAEGEATGHYHLIPKRFATVTKLYEDHGKIYLAVFRAVELIHPEHATVVVPIGNYEVGRVREFDPFTEEIRRVED